VFFEGAKRSIVGADEFVEKIMKIQKLINFPIIFYIFYKGG